MEVLQQTATKRKATFTIEELTAEVLKSPSSSTHSYNTRTRASSPSTSVFSDYINPSSVASTSSDDSFVAPKKRRGRPAKPVSALLDPNEIAALSNEEQKYRELRNKNNEASRRSRLNRKVHETQLDREANELMEDYRRLEVQEQKLVKRCERWRQAVFQLALIN